jgi:hypothetical protein
MDYDTAHEVRKLEEGTAALGARVRQLELDIGYALQAIAVLKTRYASIDERERRQELERSRGVR